MEKIKVLHIENAVDYTGGFKALLQACDQSRDQVDSIIAIKKGSKCVPILRSKGYTVYELPYVEISKRIGDLLRYIPMLLLNGYRLRKIAKKENIDLLHANDIYNLTAYVCRYVFRVRIPVLVHIRLMPSGFPQPIYRFWRSMHLKLADGIIAVSRAVKQAYLNAEKIQVVYDAEIPDEKYPDYTFSNDGNTPFHFYYLANYTPGKGQDLALLAAQKVIGDNPNIRITFAGNDMGMPGNIAYKEALQQTAVALGIEHYVFFESFVSDVEKEYKRHDAVLNFSYSESFSFTCFEALCYGIPLIASDCGGPAELFENGTSGILVKNKSVEEMAAAMLRLSRSPELCRKLSENSKIYIQQTFEKASKKDTFKSVAIALVNR